MGIDIGSHPDYQAYVESGGKVGVDVTEAVDGAIARQQQGGKIARKSLWESRHRSGTSSTAQTPIASGFGAVPATASATLAAENRSGDVTARSRVGSKDSFVGIAAAATAEQAGLPHLSSHNSLVGLADGGKEGVMAAATGVAGTNGSNSVSASPVLQPAVSPTLHPVSSHGSLASLVDVESIVRRARIAHATASGGGTPKGIRPTAVPTASGSGTASVPSSGLLGPQQSPTLGASATGSIAAPLPLSISITQRSQMQQHAGSLSPMNLGTGAGATAAVSKPLASSADTSSSRPPLSPRLSFTESGNQMQLLRLPPAAARSQLQPQPPSQPRSRVINVLQTGLNGFTGGNGGSVGDVTRGDFNIADVDTPMTDSSSVSALSPTLAAAPLIRSRLGEGAASALSPSVGGRPASASDASGFSAEEGDAGLGGVPSAAHVSRRSARLSRVIPDMPTPLGLVPANDDDGALAQVTGLDLDGRGQHNSSSHHHTPAVIRDAAAYWPGAVIHHTVNERLLHAGLTASRAANKAAAVGSSLLPGHGHLTSSSSAADGMESGLAHPSSRGLEAHSNQSASNSEGEGQQHDDAYIEHRRQRVSRVMSLSHGAPSSRGANVGAARSADNGASVQATAAAVSAANVNSTGGSARGTLSVISNPLAAASSSSAGAVVADASSSSSSSSNSNSSGSGSQGRVHMSAWPPAKGGSAVGPNR